MSSSIFDILKKVPNDQYACTKCDSVPEIIDINIDLGTVEIKCPFHGNESLNIKDYFEKELKYLYYSFECKLTSIPQKDRLNRRNYFIFNSYPDGDKNIICCESCSHHQFGKAIKVNELNCTCKKHFKKYTKYCIECRKHFCDEKECKCEHDGDQNKVKIIEKPADENIKLIKEKKRNFELKIKLLNTIIETYEKHPSNYFNALNIRNISEIFKSKKNDNMEDMKTKFEGTLNEQIEKYESMLEKERKIQENYKELLQKSLVKTENLEKEILNMLNVKLKVKLVGNEIKIDLNNKNVENIDLKLLGLVRFNNLEEMNLSHNPKLSDIEPIAKLKSPNLKKLDLSYNAINDVNPIKKLMEKQVLKVVNLDGNNLAKKEIDKIKQLLKDGISKTVSQKECNLIYEINNSNNNSIKILGKDFVNKNKEFIKIKDGDNLKEITEYYEYNKSKDKYTLNITLIINDNIKDISKMFSQCQNLKSVGKFDLDLSNITNISDLFCECSSLTYLPPSMSEWNTSKVTDMSGLFYGCSSLKSLPDISKWDTSNVKNMMSVFNNCKSLEKLPDISKWKVQNATNLSCMFAFCSSLTEIPKGISNWDIKNATNLGNMFNGCSKLEDLSGLTKWNTSSVTDMNNMFKGCTSMKKRPDIKKWNMKNVNDKNGMFDNCPK